MNKVLKIMTLLLSIFAAQEVCTAATTIQLTTTQRDVLKKAVAKALVATTTLKTSSEKIDIHLVLTYLANYPSWYIASAPLVPEDQAYDILTQECKTYVASLKKYAESLKTKEILQRTATELPPSLTAFYETIIKELAL